MTKDSSGSLFCYTATMSKELEKIYRVESFDAMYDKIAALKAQPTIDVRSTHYYAHLDSNDTIKMIDYGDRIEIHEVGYSNGLYSIDKVIKVSDITAGFAWFRDRGFNELDLLAMHDKEYAYGDGGFALYTIEGSIFSVILGYTSEQMPKMEQVFELGSAEQIAIPYNKYVAQTRKLRTVAVS